MIIKKCFLTFKWKVRQKKCTINPKVFYGLLNNLNKILDYEKNILKPTYLFSLNIKHTFLIHPKHKFYINIFKVKYMRNLKANVIKIVQGLA